MKTKIILFTTFIIQKSSHDKNNFVFDLFHAILKPEQNIVNRKSTSIKNKT